MSAFTNMVNSVSAGSDPCVSSSPSSSFESIEVKGAFYFLTVGDLIQILTECIFKYPHVATAIHRYNFHDFNPSIPAPSPLKLALHGGDNSAKSSSTGLPLKNLDIDIPYNLKSLNEFEEYQKGLEE